MMRRRGFGLVVSLTLLAGCGDDTGGTGGTGGTGVASTSVASTSTSQTSASQGSGGNAATTGSGSTGRCASVCADFAVCDDDDDCASSCEALLAETPECFPSLEESVGCNAAQDCSGDEACLVPTLELGLCIEFACVSRIELNAASCVGAFACESAEYRFECADSGDQVDCVCFQDGVEVGTCTDNELGCYLLTGCCGDIVG